MQTTLPAGHTHAAFHYANDFSDRGEQLINYLQSVYGGAALAPDSLCLFEFPSRSPSDTNCRATAVSPQEIKRERYEAAIDWAESKEEIFTLMNVSSRFNCSLYLRITLCSYRVFYELINPFLLQ